MGAATFTFKGATIEVRRMTVRDRMHAQVFYARAATVRKGMPHHALDQFVTFVTSVTVIGGSLPFDLPEFEDDADAVLQAYDDFMDCDVDLVDDWAAAYDRVHPPKKATVAEPTS